MNDPMQSLAIPGTSNFRFSAVRPDTLGATEYTLATIAVDVTASVSGFARELREAVKQVIGSLRRSPRADNLLVRLVTFNTEVIELFGFKPLRAIDADAIPDFAPQGMTALYDATFEAIAATEQYARVLYDQEFDANAAVYIITDGEDNRSQVAREPAKVAEKMRAVRRAEALESVITLLIGINTRNDATSMALARFAAEGQLDHYLDVGEASPERLAQLAGFVSKSIASQSQALGSGAPSQSLTF